MKLIRKAKSLLKCFSADQNGTMAIMLGLSAIPLLLAAGAGIDFARYNNAQTEVQSALDGAALAGAAEKDKSDAERKAIAEAAFKRNWDSIGAADLEVVATFTVKNGRMVSEAELTMPTSFMALGGIEELKSRSVAEVGIAEDKKAEVVMVLDYSWSMTEVAGSEVKYIAMKNAATSLVEDLAKTDPEKVKFGLVPFSHQVYTSLPGSHVVGGGGGIWTGCTVDRKYPHNVSNSTPTAAAATKWDPSVAPLVGPAGCAGYVMHNLRTVDLTDNFDAVADQLEKMTPYSYTHIALGVEFGYHMLSPNAPFTQGAPFGDKKTNKYMVVLTDGAQTEVGFGPGGSRTRENGEDNLEKLCASAKANDITIITLAFDLNSGPTVDRLRDCSTDPEKHFFTPDTSADLNEAFKSIKDAITAEVYLSK